MTRRKKFQPKFESGGELKPGPLAPEARIIPLDQQAPPSAKMCWQWWDSNPRPFRLVLKTSALDHSATLSLLVILPIYCWLPWESVIVHHLLLPELINKFSCPLLPVTTWTLLISKSELVKSFKFIKLPKNGTWPTSMSSNPVLVKIFSKKILSPGIEPGPPGF